MLKQGKVVSAFAAALFLALGSSALAQIAILTKPVSGGGSIFEGSEWGGYERYPYSYSGVPPDYSVGATLPGPYSEYTGAIAGGQGGVSGWLKLASIPYQTNMKASCGVNYAMDAFAEVVPGSNIKVKFNGNIHVGWKGWSNNVGGNAGLSFDALEGEDKSTGTARGSYPNLYAGDIANSIPYVSLVHPPVSSRYDYGGKTYYKLGTFSFGGMAEEFSPVNEELSLTYGASISGLEAYYVGNALSLGDGSNQSWLVGQALPKALVVRLSDGETGAAVSGVPITFTIQDPANGAKFSNGQTSIVDVTENGLAAANLTLGSVAGNYAIKATCPAAVCTSGAKEVVFTANAISDRTKINGKIKNGQCGSMTFGERTIPVNADGTFVIDDVKLVAKEENGVTKVDYEDFLSAGSCQVDVLCPNGTPFLGNPDYPECGNGAHRSAAPPAGPKEKRQNHRGIDAHGAEGVVVRAAKAGTVIHVGEFKKDNALRNKSFGWIVITKTKVGDEFEYIMYAHLQAPAPEEDPLVKVPARPGDIVNAGDPIGLMGATGNASGGVCPPHVHIEMRRSSLEIKTINNTELMPGKGRDFNSGKDTSNKFISSNVFLNTCVKWDKKGECLKRTDPENALRNDINSDCELGCKYYGKCTQKKR